MSTMSTMTPDQILDAALNPPVKPTHAEKLQRAVGWIAEFHAAEQVSFISILGKEPTIYFERFEDFQKLFGGQKATIKKNNSTWDYEVSKDGIEFGCSKWVTNPGADYDPDATVPALTSD